MTKTSRDKQALADGDDSVSLSQADFREAMAQLATAVNIVTTDGVSGRHGFTASAVCSVTDAPPTLLVCMNANARSHEHFIKNAKLAVNVLTADQAMLANTFASPLPSAERFSKAHWQTAVTGAPLLADALVGFDCLISQITQVGTHSIFICQVQAVQYADADDAKALGYFRRSYQSIG